MELDTAGGVVTGAMIAAAVEKPTGQAGEHHGTCDDCGAEVTGRFCSNCGQAAHTHRTLLHLGEEILHGVMHFDSRIWRTLPLLLINPGRLTREWVEGKRTRYVSPLGMYLFTVFVMFMALSFAPVSEHEVEAATSAARSGPVSTGTQLYSATNNVVQIENELQSLPEVAATAPRRAELQAKLKVAETELKAADAAMAKSPSAPDLAAIGAGWADQIRAKAKSGELKSNTGDKALDKKLDKKLQNPELALYKLQQTFYKFSFLLIPISIPFVALLFVWKRGFTLYDHGVFVLYSLTFMAILIMVVAGFARYGGPLAPVSAALPFVIPAHMFAQVKGAYRLSVFSALWRTFLLLVFCSVAFTLFLVAIIALGMTG